MPTIDELEDTLNEQIVCYRKATEHANDIWASIRETERELTLAVEEEEYLKKRSNHARRVIAFSLAAGTALLVVMSLMV